MSDNYSFTLLGKDKTANAFNSATSRVETFEKRIKQAGASLVAAFSVKQVINYADTYTLLENKIKTVTDSEEDLIDTTNRLFAISESTRSELTATVDLYTKLKRNTEELNLTNNDLYEITELINQSFQIQGATTAEAAGATLQLSQALASGVLRGQEFNSVSEQAPEILKAIGRELGANVGELRAMAKQGLLTADIVTSSLLNQADTVRSVYSETESTISQAWQSFADSAVIAVGRIDEKIGTSSTLTQWIKDLTTEFKIFNGTATQTEIITEKISDLKEQLLTLRERGAPSSLIMDTISEISELKQELEFLKTSSGSLDEILDGVFTNRSETVGVVGLSEAQDFAKNAFQNIKDAMEEQANFEQESGEISSLLTDGIFNFDSLDASQQTEVDMWAEHYKELFNQYEEYGQQRLLMQEALENNIYNTASSYASSAADSIADAAEEGTAAQKVAFGIQQGIAAVTTVMNAELAATAALAPPPIGLGPTAGLPYSQVIRGAGYASAAVIAGQTLASFDGGGYTGSGARSSGLDGKGGFLAMLHPQETVIDHTKQSPNALPSNGNSDIKNIVINNYGSPIGNVEYMTKDDTLTLLVSEMSNQSSRTRNGLHATSNTLPKGRV